MNMRNIVIVGNSKYTELGLQQQIDKIDYINYEKSSTMILIID